MNRITKTVFALLATGMIFQNCSQSDFVAEIDPESTSGTGSNTNENFISISRNDSLALVALYKTTDGENWRRNNRWLKAPISKWAGVKTEIINGERRVTALRLGFMKLKGQLPEEIKALTELKALDLSYNYSLKGQIIEEIYSCQNLKVLKLAFTSLSGKLSPSIGKLTQLDTLDLWTSEWELEGVSWDKNPYTLTGELPRELGNLKVLRFLRLGRQNFTGKLPEEIGNMEQLEFLDIAQCQLTGNIPASLGNLKKLHTLFASKNKLNKPLPKELCLAENLKEIYLSDNQIPGEIPTNIGDLKRLRALDLSGNRLTGKIPVSIEEIMTLGLLYLDNNQLEGTIPAGIGTSKHPQMIHAGLSNNNLTGSLPVREAHDFMGGAWYTTIEVHGNKLSGIVPDSYLQFQDTRKFLLPQQKGHGFDNLN